LEEPDVPTSFSGGCLCGAVRYSCDAQPAMMGEVKGYDRAADSGNVVTRAFCPNCGAPVFSRNPAMPDLIFLRASSLDDLEIFQPQMHVFAMRAASWDAPSAGVPAFERMPPGM
jgi:hypothetical protein